jgi:signal transduction histidine kinase
VLIAAGEMNDKALHFLSTMHKSGNQLLNIVNDILDGVALDEGKLTIRHDAVDLKQAAAHVVDILTPLAKRQVDVSLLKCMWQQSFHAC